MQKHFDKPQCRQKRITTLVGIIIIVASAIILFGGVFAYQYFAIKANNEAQNQTNQITDSPAKDLSTEGWKTYKSDIYDYEIKYPPLYKVSIQPIPNGVPGIEEARYEDKDYSFTFNVFARNADFITRDCLRDLEGKNITKTIKVNGNKFYAFYEKKQGTGGYMQLVEGAMESEYHTIYNNQCYIVQYVIVPADLKSPLPSQAETNSRFEIFNKIFSTFKFTTPADQTANWKTYRNDEYGFEFKYPEAFGSLQEYKYSKYTGGLARVKALVELVSEKNYLYLAVASMNDYEFSNTGGTTIIYKDGTCVSNFTQYLEKNNNFTFQGSEGCYISEGDAGGGYIGYIIPNNKNKQIMQISISFSFSDNEEELARQNLDQILSTFKFTK